MSILLKFLSPKNDHRVGEMGVRWTGGARRTKAKTRIQKNIFYDFDIEHRKERQNIVRTAIFDQDVCLLMQRMDVKDLRAV